MYRINLLLLLSFLLSFHSLKGQTQSRPAAWPRHTVDASSKGADGVKLADLDADGRLDIATGWEEGGLTKVYLHPGSKEVKKEWPAVRVGETPDVEDAVFVDMNRDGRPEVVSCTEGRTKRIFVHWRPEKDLLTSEKWQTEILPASDGLMMWMYAEPLQIDGRHGMDLIAAGKGENAQIGWFEAPSKTDDLSKWQWHSISPVGWTMSIILKDMDRDGDLDLLITDRKKALRGCRWLENPGKRKAQKREWKNHFIGGRDVEVMFMTLADIDGDGREEALVPERTNQTIKIYRRLDERGLQWREESLSLPSFTGFAKSVEAGDMNGDGQPDLVISANTMGDKKPGLVWLDGKKIGKAAESDFQAISGAHNAKYDKVELLDLDEDGDLDVLICEENYGENSEGLGVVWYENQLNEQTPDQTDRPDLTVLKENAIRANEGFRRCRNYLDAWLGERDEHTQLIPRNLANSKDVWNAQDAAADNYPFMVLTAALLDRAVFDKDMINMLKTETKLTSRIGRLPDTYSFVKRDFQDETPDLDRIIFGASEYIKDGLLPLTEWLGDSPWSDRMLAILDDIWKYAPVETPFGHIPSNNVEVNGEMLQTLARVYWMTGEEKYLNWALRLGDYYLLGNQHPTNDLDVLRLRDHGCEIVSGLCELYFTVARVRKDKQAAYKAEIHEILDRILEVGVNEHNLMYDAVNPKTGAIVRPRIADNWGYNYNGFYTVYLVDRTEEYLQAIQKTLNNLYFYKNFDWENGSQDGYADAIEGGLNLYNRIPNPVAKDWLDSEIKVMWSMQDSSHRENTEQWRSSGIIEGWHGDGNFARTSIMYCLWKTQGAYLQPWRSDLMWGAEEQDGVLFLYLQADEDWNGRLFFDFPRHREILRLPVDYPRINQFPEWFVAEPDKKYRLTKGKKSFEYTGKELRKGIPLKLASGEEAVLRVEKL